MKKILKISLCLLLILSVMGCGSKKVQEEEQKEAKKIVLPEKKLRILDLNSKTRPYAVMINNNHDAWPHAGLSDAYLVYEIVAEGGITRMMAVFKDKSTAKIGSVRSARPYFLDYALENDAIYVHHGWSPQAKSDISSLGVNNINGLYDNAFWRDTTLKKAYEHTSFTNIEKIKKVADSKKYRTTSDNWQVLDYNLDDMDLSSMEGAIPANKISIKYSYYHTTSYEYDANKKVYNRSMSGVKHVDAITGKQYTAKNIITYKVTDYALNDGSKKDRRALKNIGSGEGYYISDGYAVPITWSKSSRSSKTVYRFKNGEKIKVNDGNTYIQIQPTGQQLSIS